jgi:DNA-binding transcriptional ArsR family regulator
MNLTKKNGKPNFTNISKAAGIGYHETMCAAKRGVDVFDLPSLNKWASIRKASSGELCLNKIARIVGCSDDAVRKARKAGIDITDMAAVEQYWKENRNDGSVAAAALAAGVHGETIRRYKAQGIDVSDPSAVRAHRDDFGKRIAAKTVARMHNPELRQSIKELRDRKYSMTEIAEALGKAKSTIRKHLRALRMDGAIRANQSTHLNLVESKAARLIMCQRRMEARVIRKSADWSAHPVAIREEMRLAYHRTKTPESMRRTAEKTQAYYAKHKHCPIYRAARRSKFERWRSKPKNKIRSNLSARLWIAINRRGGKKNHSILKIVGCDLDYLIAHLERQFAKGMNWDNYGSVWHVDHIVPCAYFDLTRYEEQCRCFHFTNLRPLWAEQNIREGNRRGQCQVSLGI